MSGDHKPAEKLHQEIADAKLLVNVGGKYTHYKNPSKTYTILHIGVIEANDGLCVIYKADYDPDLVFVRPLHNWLEQIQIDGRAVDRFSSVTD